MKQLVLIFIFSIFVHAAFAGGDASFCKAVEKGNFAKVERKFKRQMKKYRHGVQFDNGPGSGMQFSHTQGLDSLVAWFKKKSCVEDAAWDKCQMKQMSYPGYSSVGVRFKVGAGIVERCFLIQEGTLGSINIFGWHPHLFKAKNKLVYKKMYEQFGFVQRQKELCKEIGVK